MTQRELKNRAWQYELRADDLPYLTLPETIIDVNNDFNDLSDWIYRQLTFNADRLMFDGVVLELLPDIKESEIEQILMPFTEKGKVMKL